MCVNVTFQRKGKKSKGGIVGWVGGGWVRSEGCPPQTQVWSRCWAPGMLMREKVEAAAMRYSREGVLLLAARANLALLGRFIYLNLI